MRAVQIDLNPIRIGLRYPVEVGLVGDSKRSLRGLIPHLRRNPNRAFLSRAQENMRDWWQLMEKRGTRTDTPMKPQVLQGLHRQEQHAGTDQVGADGVPGQPGIRRGPPAHRLRQIHPEACGARGFTIREPGNCGQIVEEALKPPLPPSITVEQASRFTESLISGQPHRGKIALTVLEDKVKELV